jgi:hypothetical protein
MGASSPAGEDKSSFMQADVFWVMSSDSTLDTWAGTLVGVGGKCRK